MSPDPRTFGGADRDPFDPVVRIYFPAADPIVSVSNLMSSTTSAPSPCFTDTFRFRARRAGSPSLSSHDLVIAFIAAEHVSRSRPYDALDAIVSVARGVTLVERGVGEIDRDCICR